jgi:hypothetical protein
VVLEDDAPITRSVIEETVVAADTDLDDLLGPLRSAATGAELAGETSYVDAMARHHRRQKGHIMFTSRRARVATFVAAGVIGFGGIAAASPGGPFALTGSDDTTTTSEVTTTTSEVTTTTSEVPTTTSEVTTTTSVVVLEDDAPITRSVIEQVTDDPTLVDDPATDFDVTTCFGLDPAQFDNHGEFVSAVARGDVELPEGIEQRDAAQSSCGKDDDDEVEVKDIDDDDGIDHDRSDDDGDDSDDDSDSDDDDSDDDRPEKSGKPDKPGKPESAGKPGNGSKKNSDD